uniref:Uncharacterized protein n=1 Tax=Taeniopygia guttata TaxID=59729 RepID=A0A674HHL5_TAEGU
KGKTGYGNRAVSQLLRDITIGLPNGTHKGSQVPYQCRNQLPSFLGMPGCGIQKNPGLLGCTVVLQSCQLSIKLYSISLLCLVLQIPS